ncbi:MAG: hypothetical protein B7Y35_06180 [Sphingomonadales bacterium 28-64-96]|nr:MAG: hypothetical protein B7Y35_06180 [Sphingomonadales bacterium 28-64-96]
MLDIPPAHCADQIPESLKADTPGAPPPIVAPQPAITGDALADALAGKRWAEQLARGWMGTATGNAGQIGVGNAGKRTIMEIYTRCEAREAEIRAALQPKRKFLGLF